MAEDVHALESRRGEDGDLFDGTAEEETLNTRQVGANKTTNNNVVLCSACRPVDGGGRD